MGKFIKKVCGFLAFCILLSVLPSVLVDPFNVFHWRSIRNIGSEPNKNYIKTRYILENPGKYNAFLFGSSRVGAIHVEKIPGETVYNMTYSDGTPYEHLDTIRTFLKAGIVPKTIYLGVDSRSYTIDGEAHMQEPLRASYSYLVHHPLEFIGMYFDGTRIVQFYEDGLNIPIMNGYTSFYSYGWTQKYGIQTKFDRILEDYSVGESYRMEKTLEEIQEIKDCCSQNGIRLVVFTNPMTVGTYRKSLDLDYVLFLSELAKITDFYNFSGINNITSDPTCFVDKSHYTAEVGDKMIEVLTGGQPDAELLAQGFGYFVTQENINEFLRCLENGEQL